MTGIGGRAGDLLRWDSASDPEDDGERENSGDLRWREQWLTGENSGDLARGVCPGGDDGDGDGRRLTGDGEKPGDLAGVLYGTGDAAMTGEIDAPAFIMYRIWSSRSGVATFTLDKMVI